MFIKLLFSTKIALRYFNIVQLVSDTAFKVASLLRAMVFPCATCRLYKGLSIFQKQIFFFCKLVLGVRLTQ